MDWLHILMGAVIAILGGISPVMLSRFISQAEKREKEKEQHEKDIMDRMRKLEEGQKALLRDRILQGCRHFCNQGYVPPQEFENLEALYIAYSAEGGNGLAHRAFEALKDLPYDKPAGE